MSHQPFERWLLSGEELAAEETLAVQGHLAVCPACRALAAAWAEVEGDLRMAPMARPTPGFTRRWQARRAQAEGKAQARQAWLALAMALGGAGALLAVLGVGLMGSFGQLAARALQTAAGWAADIRLVTDLFRAFAQGLPQPLSLVSGAGLGGVLALTLVGLAAAWFVAVQRLVIRVH
jgi:predicted anti-sigma-YlaC factor YlaD